MLCKIHQTIMAQAKAFFKLQRLYLCGIIHVCCWCMLLFYFGLHLVSNVEIDGMRPQLIHCKYLEL